jgi:hypothetical protein
MTFSEDFERMERGWTSEPAIARALRILHPESGEAEQDRLDREWREHVEEPLAEREAAAAALDWDDLAELQSSWPAGTFSRERRLPGRRDAGDALVGPDGRRYAYNPARGAMDVVG